MGRAEAGLRTLESALRYMLSPPYWYFFYCARVLVLARRPGESVAQFASLSRVDGPRNLGWQVVALAHDGQIEEACVVGERFVKATRQAWRGDPLAGPREFASWFLNITPLAGREDREYLRDGLRLADLPC